VTIGPTCGLSTETGEGDPESAYVHRETKEKIEIIIPGDDPTGENVEQYVKESACTHHKWTYNEWGGAR